LPQLPFRQKRGLPTDPSAKGALDHGKGSGATTLDRRD
jgi:hypothetical protein